MMFYGQDDLDSVRRLVWGRLFGQCVEKTRQAAGRSVAEAAHLAGMEASEWSAVEAGFVPIQPSCAPWPMLWRFDTTGSPPWLFSAGVPGSSRSRLPPPRTSRGTGGEYSQSHMLTSRGRG